MPAVELKTLINVVINRAAVCSSGERAITWNAAGPRGAKGSTGTPGTDGSSIVTSAGAAGGSCATGDSDVDLASGEVYSCVSSAWSDTGSSLKGPSGGVGPRGATGPVGPAGPLQIDALSLVDSLPQFALFFVPLELGTVTGQVGSSLAAGPNSVTFVTSGSYLVAVGLTVEFGAIPLTFEALQNGVAIPGFTGVIDSLDGSVTMAGIVTAAAGDLLTVNESAPGPAEVTNIQVTVTRLS